MRESVRPLELHDEARGLVGRLFVAGLRIIEWWFWSGRTNERKRLWNRLGTCIHDESVRSFHDFSVSKPKNVVGCANDRAGFECTDESARINGIQLVLVLLVLVV
jgi:hypothetical protein